MQVDAFITQQLESALAPEYLEVVNESHMHNVPADAQTHFKATVVSSHFEGSRLLARHRKVNELLAEALAGPVHALALHTFTPQEWQTRGQAAQVSPQCRGGSAEQ